MSLFEFSNQLHHNMLIHDLAESKNISLDAARQYLSTLSFVEYHKLCEAGTNIIPPSGNTIGPSSQVQKPATSPQQSSGGAKSTWTGKGPLQVGMTVGVNGKDNMPIPHAVSRIDTATNGVVVKDPQTGKEQTMNVADLQPFVAQGQSQNIQPGTTQQQENAQLMRLRELAGIKENCSAGATGAGAIAIAPADMGKVKKRQATDEELKKEYTRTAPAKTVVGDTKPNQNIGELSATLSANGKRSARRKART